MCVSLCHICTGRITHMYGSLHVHIGLFSYKQVSFHIYRFLFTHRVRQSKKSGFKRDSQHVLSCACRSLFTYTQVFFHIYRSLSTYVGLFSQMVVSFGLQVFFDLCRSLFTYRMRQSKKSRDRWDQQWSLLVCRSFFTCVGLFSHTGCDHQRNQETGGTQYRSLFA